jgi:hypothetical protein
LRYVVTPVILEEIAESIARPGTIIARGNLAKLSRPVVLGGPLISGDLVSLM